MQLKALDRILQTVSDEVRRFLEEAAGADDVEFQGWF